MWLTPWPDCPYFNIEIPYVGPNQISKLNCKVRISIFNSFWDSFCHFTQCKNMWNKTEVFWVFFKNHFSKSVYLLLVLEYFPNFVSCCCLTTTRILVDQFFLKEEVILWVREPYSMLQEPHHSMLENIIYVTLTHLRGEKKYQQ